MFLSNNKLSKICWARQTIDVYANEIRRLAGLSDFTVKLAFVNGFREDMSVVLQQLPNVPGTDMD